jgi:hypothetical protein
MIKSAVRIQAPWLAAARGKGRDEGWRRSTQLTRAAYEGDEKRVRELVAAGAPLDLVDGGGFSALNEASNSGHVRVAKLLLDGKYEGKGADINLRNLTGDTPLMRACINGHKSVVRLLLERGANASLSDYSGCTVMSPSIITLLEEHGIFPEYEDEYEDDEVALCASRTRSLVAAAVRISLRRRLSASTCDGARGPAK